MPKPVSEMNSPGATPWSSPYMVATFSTVGERQAGAVHPAPPNRICDTTLVGEEKLLQATRMLPSGAVDKPVTKFLRHHASWGGETAPGDADAPIRRR